MGQYTEQGYHFGLTATQIEESLNLVPSFSRPNLVHNWHFQRQINQRSASGTTTSGDLDNDRTFITDRWFIGNEYPNTSLTVSGATAKFTMTDGSLDKSIEANLGCIRQNIWRGSTIFTDGQDATLTVLCDDDSLFTGSCHINGNSVISVMDDDNIPVAKFERYGSQYILYMFNGRQDRYPIAVKLEIGIGQTLARKSNGKWVLNDVFDYFKEYDICQKFFRHAFVSMMHTRADMSNSTDTNGKIIVVANIDNYGPMASKPSIDIKHFGRMCLHVYDPSSNKDKNITVYNRGYSDTLQPGIDIALVGVGYSDMSNINIAGIKIIIDNTVITTINKGDECYISDGYNSANLGKDYPCASIALSADI